MKYNPKTKKLQTKFYNCFLSSGQKTICERNFLKTYKKLQKNNRKDHKNLVKFAVINTAHITQIKQVRRKKKILKEFPFIVNKKNRLSASIKYILNSLKNKSGMKFVDKFFSEIVFISQNKSNIIKKKENDQEQIILKKKYSFFRWFY